MSSGWRVTWGFRILGMLMLSACTASHDLAGPGLGEGDASVDEEPAGSGGRGGSTARAGSGGRSGAGARGGTGGTGGTGARGGTGGRGGVAGRAAAGSGAAAMCGNCPMPGFVAGLATATSCCTASNVCGLTAPTLGVTDCQPLEGPGEADESCPGAVIFSILPLDGCCRPDGTCGVLDTLLGLGCARLTTLGSPQRCTP